MGVKPKPETASTLLALDIGTSSVKCILARPTESDKKGIINSKLKILGFERAPQLPGNIKNGGIADIPGTLEVCEKALSSLEKKTGERAKSVVVGVSGEAVRGSITTIRYRRHSPKKSLSESELKELLEKIEIRAKKKALAAAELELGGENAELSLVNSALVSLSIDGYRVNNPVGFKGAEILIEYYTAFAPSIFVSAIEKICSELELDLLTIVAEPFALCRARLGDASNGDQSAILIDIGAGTTDLAVLNDGQIVGTKSINIAGDSFTRQLSESFHLKTPLAEKYKVNLDDEALLSDAMIGKLTSALNRSLSVWLAGVALALEDICGSRPLPSDLFLCGGSASLLPLEELLATSDWHKSLSFSCRPLVRLLDPVSLPDLSFPDDAEATLDFDPSFVVPLGLLRVAVDTLLASPEKTDLRTKLAKLLAR